METQQVPVESEEAQKPEEQKTKKVAEKPEKPKAKPATDPNTLAVERATEIEMKAQVVAGTAKEIAKAAEEVKKAVTKKKAAAASAVPAKAKQAKAPKSGQSGPPLDLGYGDLNDNERKVVAVFKGKGERKPKTIADLAKECFPSKKFAKANSWVRNSLRRLVRADWLEKMERGSYRITDKGRRRLDAALKKAA
jgi:hypothetical protein